MCYFNRELRFLVTQACNYDCVFCHKEGLQSSKKALLFAEDYRYLFKVAKEHLGWTTTTLTGGEPLVRNDIENIIAELYKELSQKLNMQIVASGGVSDIENVRILRKMDIYGAIIGKAYYTGAISLKEAIEVAK